MVNKCDFFKISELAGCCPEDPCENHGAVHMLSKKGGLAVSQESLEVAERRCFVLSFLKISFSAWPVAHICNPLHWGGRGRRARQEDHQWFEASLVYVVPGHLELHIRTLS